MPIPTDTRLQTPPTLTDSSIPYFNDIVGAAVFDLNGLPKEYFVTFESSNISWVQTIFQALGLRSLLMSSLKLEGFHHAKISGEEYSAVVVKQKACYVAMLLQKQDQAITDAFIQWAQSFQPNELKQNPRFHVA